MLEEGESSGVCRTGCWGLVRPSKEAQMPGWETGHFSLCRGPTTSSKFFTHKQRVSGGPGLIYTKFDHSESLMKPVQIPGRPTNRVREVPIHLTEPLNFSNHYGAPAGNPVLLLGMFAGHFL